MGLGQFQTDRSATDNEEPAGQPLSFEDGLVGQVGNLVQTGDGRHLGRGSGRDDETPGTDAGVPGLDGSLVEEARLRLDHPDAQRSETLDRVIGSDRFDHALHMTVHSREIDFGLHAAHPERRGMTHAFGELGRCDQRLGRHAAIIQAIAAHASALDENNRDTKSRGCGCDGQPA